MRRNPIPDEENFKNTVNKFKYGEEETKNYLMLLTEISWITVQRKLDWNRRQNYTDSEVIIFIITFYAVQQGSNSGYYTSKWSTTRDLSITMKEMRSLNLYILDAS